MPHKAPARSPPVRPSARQGPRPARHPDQSHALLMLNGGGSETGSTLVLKLKVVF